MGSNDIFQQKMIAQMHENEKNAEQHGGGDKKPNLLKRVGRSLQRIVEAPLHVVGGVLEAANHALHGRLDRSARSIAGGFKAGFGSLNEAFRGPLVKDTVKKVEGTASKINEKMEFTDKDDSDIQKAEEKLKKAVEGILAQYDGLSDDDLVRKTEELRKQVIDEISKKKQEKKKELEEVNYDKIKSAIPGAPKNFKDLSEVQKKALQSMYFNREEKPNLHRDEVSQYFEKLLVATKTNATEQEKNDLHIFTAQNYDSLRKSLKVSQLESTVFDYYLHKAEIARRKQREPGSTIGDTLGGDGFVNTDTY